MSIFRWWRERSHPEERCERTGHKPGKRRLTMLRKPAGLEGRWPTYALATRVVAEMEMCRRCKEPLSEPVTMTSRPLTTVALSPEGWDTFEDSGQIILQTRWV